MSGSLNHAVALCTAALQEICYGLGSEDGIQSVTCYPGLVNVVVDWPRFTQLCRLGAIRPKYKSPSSVSTFAAVHTALWGELRQHVEIRIVSMEPAPVEDSTWPPF